MSHKKHLVLVGILAAALGLLAGGLGVGWWMHQPSDSDQQAQLLEHELLIAQGDLIQVQARLDAAQAHAAVEASTSKALEATLQSTQAELGAVRDQLAFFNDLLPPGPAGSVAIRALDIEQIGPNLQYRALLMRSGAAGTPFQGTLQFIAQGLQDDKAAKIELQSAQASVVEAESDAGPAQGFPVEFDQFQRSSGLLSVPPGFLAQTITLNVLEGSTVRVSRTVSLPVQQ